MATNTTLRTLIAIFATALTAYSQVTPGQIPFEQADGTGKLKTKYLPQNSDDFAIQAWTQQVNKAGSLSSLSEPINVWHRGATLVGPDNTMQAYDKAVSMGATVIECDVQSTLDQVAVLLHDPTVDFVSTSTGAIANYGYNGTQTLLIDASTWATGWTDFIGLATFDELVRKYGNKVVIIAEIKDNLDSTASLIIDVLNKYRINSDMALIYSSVNSCLQVVRSAGYQTMITGDALVPATVQSQGHEYILASTAVSQPYIQSFQDIGIKAMIYTVSLQWDYAAAQALGPNGIFSNDPLYSSNQHTKRLTDPFTIQNTWIGFYGENIIDSAYWQSPNKFGLNTLTTAGPASRLVTMGWMGPITDSSNYSLSWTSDLITANTTAGWTSIYLGVTDRFFPANGFRTGVNGYHCVLRKGGVLTFNRVDQGVETNLYNGGLGPARVDGDTALYRITVAPTTITVERLDGTPDTIVINDATYRGLPYLELGGSGSNYMSSNFVLVP